MDIFFTITEERLLGHLANVEDILSFMAPPQSEFYQQNTGEEDSGVQLAEPQPVDYDSGEPPDQEQ